MKRGWNGCLSVPRVLTLEKGKLIQKPAPELATLRRDEKPVNSQQIEASIVLEAGRSLDLRVLKWDGENLNASGTTLKLGSDHQTSKLQVFIDHALMEVFVSDGQRCVTRVIDPLAGTELKSDGGQPERVWELKSIW